MPERLFIIRKQIMATNAKEALRLDRKAEIVAVFEDEDTKPSGNCRTNAVGFEIERDED